ncbi:integrase core domain-containing protein, partial [Burkholderia vietnamiensis]|uniref:integrase core domain-containing protein n=1 Tax=Burkholderia vietnamiensis TaxID=60552 RepID=UPI001CF5EDAF
MSCATPILPSGPLGHVPEMTGHVAEIAGHDPETAGHVRPKYATLIHHSDRGAQYVSIRYSERLAEAGIEPSVGSRGDSYDNALAETINGLYKTELIHRRAPWKTRESVELATLEWVAWYNHHRLMEPLGYIPPAEAEANYYRQLRNAAEVPALT